MRSLWLLLLTGCEKMDDPGPLFSAAQVDAPAAIGAESEAPASTPAFDFPEPEVISSEELQSGNFGTGSELAAEPPEEPTPAEAEPEVAAEEPEAAEPVAVEQSPETVAVGSSTIAPAPVVTTPALSAWPVRLVKTISDTNPPRAILGLPGGEELVVSPGTMVPEHGLVVIAIGPNSAQLAQITPQGDHAAVSPMTLQAMY